MGLILNPNPDSPIILESSRRNLILRRVTGNRDDGISMAFKFLDHSFRLKIPQVYAVILGTTNNVFPICHRKCRCYAVHFVQMPRIDLQELPNRVVAQPLQQQQQQQKLHIKLTTQLMLPNSNSIDSEEQVKPSAQKSQ